MQQLKINSLGKFKGHWLGPNCHPLAIPSTGIHSPRQIDSNLLRLLDALLGAGAGEAFEGIVREGGAVEFRRVELVGGHLIAAFVVPPEIAGDLRRGSSVLFRRGGLGEGSAREGEGAFAFIELKIALL